MGSDLTLGRLALTVPSYRRQSRGTPRGPPPRYRCDTEQRSEPIRDKYCVCLEAVARSVRGPVLGVEKLAAVLAAIPARAFGAPQVLSQPGRHAGAGRVAFDGAGNAVAVWRRRSDATRKYRSRRRCARPAACSVRR